MIEQIRTGKTSELQRASQLVSEIWTLSADHHTWCDCGDHPAGSERGGQRAAAIYTLIGTAKMNDIDPQAWLADVIARISDMPVSHLHELLPWHWNTATPQVRAA